MWKIFETHIRVCLAVRPSPKNQSSKIAFFNRWRVGGTAFAMTFRKTLSVMASTLEHIRLTMSVSLCPAAMQQKLIWQMSDLRGPSQMELDRIPKQQPSGQRTHFSHRGASHVQLNSEHVSRIGCARAQNTEISRSCSHGGHIPAYH